jgi:hypothetical protein
MTEPEAPKASQLDSAPLVHYVHNALQAPRGHRVDLVLRELDSGCHMLHEFWPCSYTPHLYMSGPRHRA